MQDTRATTSTNHLPVINKNIPIKWNTSALEEKHTMRRMRSAKTGKDINKIQNLCSDAKTQEEYLDRESSSTKKGSTQCYMCQSLGHTTKDCIAESDTYCHCSENHKSRDCLKSTKRCANCHGEHPSNYNGCPRKQEAMKSKKITTLTQAQATMKASDEMECIKLALTLTAIFTEAHWHQL